MIVEGEDSSELQIVNQLSLRKKISLTKIKNKTFSIK